MPEMYQLELVTARVAPAEEPLEDGIRLKNGKTLPFLVERTWSGPAGSYNEQWSIRRGGKEIVYGSESKPIWVKGLQSIRTYTDRVDEPISLEAGTYNLVFVAEGYFMGSREITAAEAGGPENSADRPKEEVPG
ncbi:MAG: hypothetical protein ACRDIA_05220 [Actinomycetota bacterium]